MYIIFCLRNPEFVFDWSSWMTLLIVYCTTNHQIPCSPYKNHHYAISRSSIISIIMIASFPLSEENYLRRVSGIFETRGSATLRCLHELYTRYNIRPDELKTRHFPNRQYGKHRFHRRLRWTNRVITNVGRNGRLRFHERQIGVFTLFHRREKCTEIHRRSNTQWIDI